MGKIKKGILLLIFILLFTCIINANEKNNSKKTAFSFSEYIGMNNLKKAEVYSKSLNKLKKAIDTSRAMGVVGASMMGGSFWLVVIFGCILIVRSKQPITKKDFENERQIESFIKLYYVLYPIFIINLAAFVIGFVLMLVGFIHAAFAGTGKRYRRASLEINSDEKYVDMSIKFKLD